MSPATWPNILLSRVWLLTGSSWCFPVQSHKAAPFVSRRLGHGELGHLLYNATDDAGGSSVPNVCFKLCDCTKENFVLSTLVCSCFSLKRPQVSFLFVLTNLGLWRHQVSHNENMLVYTNSERVGNIQAQTVTLATFYWNDYQYSEQVKNDPACKMTDWKLAVIYSCCSWAEVCCNRFLLWV